MDNHPLRMGPLEHLVFVVQAERADTRRGCTGASKDQTTGRVSQPKHEGAQLARAPGQKNLEGLQLGAQENQ